MAAPPRGAAQGGAVAREPLLEEDEGAWKAPIWQKQLERKTIMAAHEDGPLSAAKREGYLQKRAGTSHLRWNIRFFEVKDGSIRWWRPAFKDQLFQSKKGPMVAMAEPRPPPVKELDLRQLKCVIRTKVKFPYSTRIALKFQEDYTDYQLELRAEKELEIIEWYKLFLRFTMESFEVEAEAEAEPAGGPADGDSDSDREVAAAAAGSMLSAGLVRAKDGGALQQPAARPAGGP
ncbi:unnamed protein product, partial [Prorocentrum cordatum]